MRRSGCRPSCTTQFMSAASAHVRPQRAIPGLTFSRRQQLEESRELAEQQREDIDQLR